MAVYLLEAKCPVCKETFNPEGPDDLQHLVLECMEPAPYYIEIHDDGRRFEVHTSLGGLQERLLDRAVASARARKAMPPIKFRPLPADTQDDLVMHFESAPIDAPPIRLPDTKSLIEAVDQIRGTPTGRLRSKNPPIQ